ncbi:Histone deacetylase hda1 [Lignoscripta atroalba]|nr:Histone deacetylase hda1 [Lignoscripta atroalba]
MNAQPTEDSLPRFSGIISFVAENPLRPVTESNIYYLSKWYFSKSLIFVENTHPAWYPDRPRKPGKRFGKIIRSPVTGLNEMLMRHKGEVERFLLERITVNTATATVTTTTTTTTTASTAVRKEGIRSRVQSQGRGRPGADFDFDVEAFREGVQSQVQPQGQGQGHVDVDLEAFRE